MSMQVYSVRFFGDVDAHPMCVLRGQQFDKVAIAWLQSCGHGSAGVEFYSISDLEIEARIGGTLLATFSHFASR